MADTTTKTYSPEELRRQGFVIEKILRTGTREELDRLKGMYRDPDVHPQVKILIREVAAMEKMGALFTEQDTSPVPERRSVGMRPGRRK